MNTDQGAQEQTQAPAEGTAPAIVPTQTNDPAPARSNNPASVKIIRNVTTTIIALAVLVFSAYLFKIGQAGIGGTIAGVVIAHYFSGIQNTGATAQIADVMKEFTNAFAIITPTNKK